MTAAAATKSTPPTVLVALNAITAATVFAEGGVEEILTKIEKELRSVHTDISTKAGRETLNSTAYKVSRAKTILDDMGKEFVADLKKQTGAVDADRRKIRERLDTLKDEIRKPLTEWEDAEQARVDAHQDAMNRIEALVSFDEPEPTADMIRDRVLELEGREPRDFQEFEERADRAIDAAGKCLAAMLASAERREADAAELATLREQQAIRDAKDNEERIAREDADRIRLAAEQAAQAERDRAEQNRQDAERRVKEADDARIAAEKKAADAVVAERERVANLELAEKVATAKREANKRHAAKINNEVLAALVALGVNDKTGKDIIASIVRGEIPHTTISY